MEQKSGRLDRQELLSLAHMFEKRVELSYGRTAYVTVASGVWKEVLWEEFHHAVQEFAGGLLSLDVKPGDRICMIAENRPESYIVIMATLMVGAIFAPCYHNETADGLLHVVNNVGAEIIIGEDQEHLDKIAQIRPKIKSFRKAILYEKYEPKDLPWAMSFKDLMAQGKERLEEAKPVLRERVKNQRGEDTAVIIHTSGTTGPPKGVILTNRSQLFFANSYREALPLTPSDVVMLYLPLAHVGGLSAGLFFQIYADVTGFFAESWDELPANLLEVCPTFYTSMPRILEKYYTRIRTQIDDSPFLQRKLSLWCLEVGRKAGSLKLEGRRVPPVLRAQNLLADAILFRKIRELFGGRIRFAASGGAPISKVIIDFFHSVGLLILEQYGSTEAGVLTANTESQYRFGSVGKPLSGVEVGIAEDDGEILCRGESLCKGYWNDEEETRKLFNEDGWLRTGDIGEIDADGFLWITDRKKDILVTAGGKNVAPANVENLMKTSKYIEDCAVFGDKKKYLVALFTLDEDETTKFARDESIIFADLGDLTEKPEVVELISHTVNELNSRLPSVAQIKYFDILPDRLDIDENEVTPTMKVKRRILAKKYASRIEKLYR